jgi:predicted anti-sigma-YlaC factor YlaD
MATKIIQDTNIPRLSPSVGVAATSVPIALKSGYLRVTIGSTAGSAGGYIAIGTNPVATANNYHITSYSIDILKETMKRQVIVGVTTGTTTKLTFDNNSGNPFVATDYVTIEGAPTVGLNTTHNSIVALDDSSITIAFNSSSITSPNVLGATVARSVKVSCLSYEPNTFFNIAEVVTLVSE